MLLAALLGIMGFALWVTAYRSTQDALGMASSEQARTVRMDVLADAMARAGHLLETGAPPYASYSCVSRHRTAAGEWQAVETRLATTEELRRLPAMPSLFHDGERSRGRNRSG